MSVLCGCAAFFIMYRLRKRKTMSDVYALTIQVLMLAILIAMLGLLAMSTYFAGQRSKDIAVRKVFGSTVEGELWHSVREYMTLVAVACLIGIPVAVWAAQKYLEHYICRLHNYWWLFALAVLLTFVMAFGTVLWQILKAANTNPAAELKKE